MLPVIDLSPDEVARGLAEDRFLLIDVREPHEWAQARLADAALIPLSSFDPGAIPNPEGREVVFLCAGGVRSVRASQAAQAAGLPYHHHLAGGLNAWIMAGHGVERG